MVRWIHAELQSIAEKLRLTTSENRQKYLRAFTGSLWVTGSFIGYMYHCLPLKWLQSCHLHFGEHVYMALCGSDSHEVSKTLQIFFFFKSDRFSNWNHSQLIDNNRQIKKHFI